MLLSNLWAFKAGNPTVFLLSFLFLSLLRLYPQGDGWVRGENVVDMQSHSFETEGTWTSPKMLPHGRDPGATLVPAGALS